MSEARLSPEAVIALERQYRFQWEEKQGAFVLLYPEGMVRLEGSGAEIMKRVDGERSIDAIIQDLQGAFPGVDLKQDVLDYLEKAYGRGYIRIK
jgi:pyrroloquinoline quinone biosynthesis protein D